MNFIGYDLVQNNYYDMYQGADPQPVDGADFDQSETGTGAVSRDVSRQEGAGHSLDH